MAVRLLITACLLFVLFRGVFATYHLGHDVLYRQGVEATSRRDINVRIPEGQNTEETTGQLKKLGLTQDTQAFRVQSLFLGRKVRVGEYHLNTSKTIDEMLEFLSIASGKWRNGKS